MKDISKKNITDPVDLIADLKPMEAKRTKDQVWSELEQMINKPLPQQAKVKKLNVNKWSIAASIAFAFILASIATSRFYTKTISCSPGEQMDAFLPDGSKVQLNSQTSIAYHPLWWKFNREVKLNGEAYFEVKKGEKFTVISAAGETSVLGTSFNIFARDNQYQVTCLTGKVRVLAYKQNEELIITPNQMVGVDNFGKINANLNVDAKLSKQWTNGKFIFTQVPLKNVLLEIARRYDIQTKDIENLDQLYTGSFEKDDQVETVLKTVCKPFDIEFKKLSSAEFVFMETR